MTTPWSRRAFLYATGSSALALGIAGAPRAEAADAYDALRATWRTLILGTGFSPTAEPFKSRLADLGSAASALLSTMAPVSGSLWPDAVYADPDPDTDQESYGYSARMNDSYTRLRTMAEAYSLRAPDSPATAPSPPP